MKKILSLLGILGFVWVVQVSLGGHSSQLLQLTSLVGVVGLTILFSIRQVGLKTTSRALFASVAETQHAPSEFNEFNSSIGSHALISANIIAVMGLIRVMSMLNEPAQIGYGIAVAFLAYVYGMLLAGLLPVGNSRQQEKKRGLSNGELMLPAAMLGAIFMTVMFAIQFHR